VTAGGELVDSGFCGGEIHAGGLAEDFDGFDFFSGAEEFGDLGDVHRVAEDRA
jgi:hypothetical protein